MQHRIFEWSTATYAKKMAESANGKGRSLRDLLWISWRCVAVDETEPHGYDLHRLARVRKSAFPSSEPDKCAPKESDTPTVYLIKNAVLHHVLMPEYTLFYHRERFLNEFVKDLMN